MSLNYRPLASLTFTFTALGCCLLAFVAIFAAAPAQAIEELITEEDISDLIIHSMRHRGAEKDNGEQQWAILPQLGYGPDTGPVVGVKYTHRNILGSGMTFDIDGTYAALNAQQSTGIKIQQPHIANDQFLVTLWGKYRFDPQREFFGFGNNDIGPDPASTHAYQDYFGVLTGGWRPLPRLAINLSVMFRKVDIRRGHRKDSCSDMFVLANGEDCPYTLDEFSGIPRVKGGKTNPISLSVVWTDRESLVRPTRGWRVLLKVGHTNKSLLSDFEFTRVMGDIGYLHPFFGERLVLGGRVDGEWMDGPDRQLAFWELPDLGGSDTLRGFFPHRFVGKRRLLMNLEARGLLTEFDFFSLYHVRLDGVVFGEGGRVFISRTDIAREFNADRPSIKYSGDLQYSYGGGLRIELGEALVARLDAGFSDEETGLFYLTFGQTF